MELRENDVLRKGIDSLRRKSIGGAVGLRGGRCTRTSMRIDSSQEHRGCRGASSGSPRSVSEVGGESQEHRGCRGASRPMQEEELTTRTTSQQHLGCRGASSSRRTFPVVTIACRKSIGAAVGLRDCHFPAPPVATASQEHRGCRGASSMGSNQGLAGRRSSQEHRGCRGASRRQHPDPFGGVRGVARASGLPWSSEIGCTNRRGPASHVARASGLPWSFEGNGTSVSGYSDVDYPRSGGSYSSSASSRSCSRPVRRTACDSGNFYQSHEPYRGHHAARSIDRRTRCRLSSTYFSTSGGSRRAHRKTSSTERLSASASRASRRAEMRMCSPRSIRERNDADTRTHGRRRGAPGGCRGRADGDHQAR